MAGAVGIVFGLCVLSFTLGAALMYVLMRRREDAGGRAASASDEPVERMWVERPAVVEPVDDEYDSRPIHRNPVVGLPQLEPALAAFAEPVAEPEPAAEAEQAAEPVAAEPEPGPKPEVPVAEAAAEEAVEPEEPAAEEPVAEAATEEAATEEAATLPEPAAPQPGEQTSSAEREEFRQRYMRTFQEVRRKAGSN